MTFPDTTLDRRAWEMTGDRTRPLRERCAAAQKEKDRLKGVQLTLGGGPLSYRAWENSGNGTLVLCDRHLDARRAAGETWQLTGEAFGAKECDDCEEEL